jgi:hypothetical protein
MSVKISLDLSSVSIKLKGCYPGFVKEGDRKTDKPLVDAATGKRVFWAALVMFPRGSGGGEDVSILCRFVSETRPNIEVPADGSVAVTLVNPAAVITDRGISLSFTGIAPADDAAANKKVN